MTDDSKPASTLVARDKKGRWIGSGNPQGRKSSSMALAKHIQNTHGLDLVKMLWDIANDDTWPHRERLESIKLLLERGYGKIPQVLNVSLRDTLQELIQSLDDDELEHETQVLEAQFKEVKKNGNKNKSKK